MYGICHWQRISVYSCCMIWGICMISLFLAAVLVPSIRCPSISNRKPFFMPRLGVCVCVVRMWPVYLAEGLRFIKRISKTGRKAFDGWHAKHQSPPSMRSTLSVCVYAKAEASTFNPLPFRWHQSFVANAKSFFIHSTFMYSEYIVPIYSCDFAILTDRKILNRKCVPGWCAVALSAVAVPHGTGTFCCALHIVAICIFSVYFVLMHVEWCCRRVYVVVRWINRAYIGVKESEKEGENAMRMRSARQSPSCARSSPSCGCTPAFMIIPNIIRNAFASSLAIKYSIRTLQGASGQECSWERDLSNRIAIAWPHTIHRIVFSDKTKIGNCV